MSKEMDRILASLIVLQHQVRMVHWETRGVDLKDLHALLGDQYRGLSILIDRLAKHSMTLRDAIGLSAVRDGPMGQWSWETMITFVSNDLAMVASMAMNLDHDVYAYCTRQSQLLRDHLGLGGER